MTVGALGKLYQDGQIIIRQGELGNNMYVIQDGQVEVILETGDQEIQLDIHGPGAFFGEMAIFDRDVRSATVRALGDVRVLTVDKKNLMRRVHEDPSLAFRLVETMSQRIRELVDKVARLESEERRETDVQ
jgi:CRP-like cAMP-binding protein